MLGRMWLCRTSPHREPVTSPFRGTSLNVSASPAYEQGVKFYQEGAVTEQEITDLVTLAKKFNVYYKITGKRQG